MIFGLFGGDKKRVAEMIAAARSGDTEKIRQLLTKGADINAPEPESGDTPLLAAIDKDQWSAAELLLQQKPDLTLEDKNGNSPLYLAVSRGDSALSMVNLLLEAGAQVDLGPKGGDNAGATPLHIACATGANGCIESLLRHGASVTKKLPSGASPLHTASIGGDQRTIELLCKAGGSVSALNEDKRTPLHNCGITGNAKAAAALIRQGAQVDGPDAEGCTPLLRAAMTNHAAVAKVLLDNGADPDVVVRTDGTPLYPLFVAAMNGFDDVVRVLLDRGVNVTAKVEGVPSPVDAAKHKGHEASAKLIAAAIKKKKAAEKDALNSGKEAEKLWQRLIQAISQKDQDGLRALANGKVFSSLSVDARLLVACALGDAEIAREALQAGANPNKPCNEGFDGVTPLVMAVGISRSLEVTSLLIDAGADVNIEWSEDTTPIFETTADQFYDLAKLLVLKGANVNVRMGNGLTPLMFAARNGASMCVDLFLDAGADINAVEDEHGVGAFGLALNRLDLQLAEHLLSRGAEPKFGSIETLPLAIAEHGSLAFIHALEVRGCKLVRDDQRGRIAFVSARNPDPEVFDYLLNHGADPSEGNDFGYTPLILAALNNHSNLIRRYLERGDDPSVRDIDGETALSLALEKRNNDAVAALREFHVEEKDYSSLTPDVAMLKAAEDGSLGTILKLRDEGISINSDDEAGNTPMLLAVKAGHLGVVRTLFHLGADINHRNHEGETALAIAKASESTGIVNSLQEFGALDSMDGEIGKLSGMFGGISVFNAADTMFGRLSHPYKQQPPYEEPESENDDADIDADDSDSYEDDVPEAIDASASVESKLDQIEQILNDEEVREKLPEAVLEHLTQKLEHWRELVSESEFGDDELADLNELLGMLGLGDEKTEEVARTPLFEAVNSQDLSAIKKLIKSGSDVNEVDGEGNPVLLIAVLTREPKLVDGLLKLGADPNKARPDGKGPLFGAVRVGEDKICQLLLKAGAKVDATFSMDHNGTPVSGCTALYVAATLGQLSSCRVLLANGAQVDAANDLGYTPLMAALDGGHADVVDLLLKSGADVNPKVIARIDVKGLGGATALYIATRKEDLASIRKLLKSGADVNRRSGNGWTPLKSAAQQGNVDIVKALLNAGADPNIADNTNYTPLMNAVSGEHVDIVKLLLKFKADPNVQSGDNSEDEDWEAGRTALMDAALSGNVSIAHELLKHGANSNLRTAKGRSALHSAVFSANAEMVSLILKSGSDGNARVNRNGKESLTPLDMALGRWAELKDGEREADACKVLELMFKKGLPNDLSSLTETALNLLTSGHEKAIELVQERGILIDVDEQSQGATRLFMYAGLGDFGLDAARALLKYGANPNFRNKHGLPVISLAVRQGGEKLVETLLKAGADAMARNGNGVLPYDLAVIYGHHELASSLIDVMNAKAPKIDLQDADGNTALMRAVKSADLMSVKQLLSEGAAADRRDLQGDTPLSYAVVHDLVEIVDALRATGVEVTSSFDGRPPLVSAARRGALGTVLDLLDTGAAIEEVDDDGETALTAAVVHPGILKVLVKYGASLAHKNKSENTAYMIASASDRSLIIRLLEVLGSSVESPAETDSSTMKSMLRRSVVNQIDHLEEQLSENRELMGAAEKDELELALVNTRQAVVKGRLSTDDSDGIGTDSDPEVKPDIEELLMASLMGDAVTVSNQIVAGVDVNYENDEGRTALAMAIQGLMQDEISRRRERNFEQILDMLLVAGADPKVGVFPYLVFAAMGKRVHLVNAFLRAGASIDRTIGEGQTALFMSLLAPDAGMPTDDRCALALLKAGADSSLKHESGALPIHLAAASNYLGALQELLKRRPQDVDAKTSIGITPLMQAATEGHSEAVSLLLKFGADPALTDDEGLTAKDVAVKNGNDDLISLLS